MLFGTVKTPLGKLSLFVLRFIILGCCLVLSTTLYAKEWDPRLLQASEQAYQGNYPSAHELVLSYIEEYPQDPNGYMVQGMVFDWERNLTSKPRKEFFYKTIAAHKKAYKLAFQAWHKNPDSVDALINLGNSYLFLGRVYIDLGSNLKAVLTAKKAPKHLEKAQKLAPDRVEGLVALGVFHYVAGNTPGFLSAFKGLLGIKGDKEQGLKEVKLALTKEHPYKNDGLVALYHINQEYEKNYPLALVYLDQLEAQFPENPKWQTLRAETIEKQDKDMGMLQYLSVPIWCENHADHCDIKFPFLGYFNAGRLAWETGKNKMAREYLIKAISIAPTTYGKNKAEALYWVSLIDVEMGNNEAAIEKLRQVAKTKGVSKKIKNSSKKGLTLLCADKPKPASC